MRLALLFALADPPGISGASAAERPALRRFAGKTVLAHQIDCAAHLGCERVLCVASGAGPDLGSARAYCERAGLRFEIVKALPRLLGLITADDEIVLLADGILPDRAALVAALAQRPGVVGFPADPAIALGFERLDAERAWSGALRTRGDSVARLADLPPDCDIASSLMRITLQMGGRVTLLDPALLGEGTWQRRVDRQGSEGAEWRWIARQVRAAPFAAPGMALAERMGLRWAHDAGGGRWGRAPHAAACLGAALALLAALAGWPVAGLASLLGASAALAIAGMFDRVEALGARPRGTGLAMELAGWLRDGLLVALLAQMVMIVPGWLGVALPFMLVLVLRLGAAIGRPRLGALFGDRILLLAGLLPLAYMGWATIAIAALLASGLAALLWTAGVPPSQLTAD